MLSRFFSTTPGFSQNQAMYSIVWVETYLTKGDHPNALKNYKRSVALDPANENAKNIINKIESK